MRDYADGDLFQTGFSALGNGQPSRLFSSDHAGVVNTHFQWMADNGIDGVGLQRFVSELRDPRFLALRDDRVRQVRAAAEQYGRIFYIEYDISGADPSTWVQDVENDWSNVMQGQLGITSSPQYAHQNGKPVVMLWGFAFPDRPGTPDQSQQLIAWFKAQGCFVGGGVPYGWRTEGGGTKPGFLPVYAQLDLIQPWAVGALATDQDVASHFQTLVTQDKQWADARGIAYQRVIFPGFAWSNWNGGARNAIPRRGGAFFWTQAYWVRQVGVGAFIAMFDEYDEGTAIAKAAESAAMIPTDQYFLTLDADGISMSSDFYLRLAGAATRMIEGVDPQVSQVPIPYWPSGGPPPPPPPPPPAPSNDAVPPQQAATNQTVNTFTPDQAATVVTRIYRAILGRDPDPSGQAAYTPLVENGSLPTVASALATSAEFEQRRPSLTVEGFSTELYQSILDRGPDPGGDSYTQGQIEAGKAAQRVVEMFLSPEYAANNP